MVSEECVEMVLTYPALSAEMRAMLENRLRALQQEKAGIEKMLGRPRQKHVICPSCGQVIDLKR